jgi:purine-binding chemotaxis protein CheW
VGETVYGCAIDAVREIIPFRRATRLPGAPAFVHGLINLRGTIVTVLDLGSRLDAARVPLTDGSIILVAHGTRLVGVAVEEMMDVRTLALEDAAGAAESSLGMIRGLGHVDELVVVVLDMQALITQVLLT